MNTVVGNAKNSFNNFNRMMPIPGGGINYTQHDTFELPVCSAVWGNKLRGCIVDVRTIT